MKKIYKVVLEKRVSKKDLPAIPAKDHQKIFEKLKSLETDPFPIGYQKLAKIKPATYRMRQGVYRIVYRVNDTILEILVIRIGHRRDVYKK